MPHFKMHFVIAPFHVVLESLNKVDKVYKVYKAYCCPVVILPMVQSNNKATREVASLVQDNNRFTDSPV